MAKSPTPIVEVSNLVFLQDIALTVYREGKAVLGTVALRGYRPFIMWGLSSAMVALGYAFVWRFFSGSLTGNDFIALIGIVAPLMQQLFQRHLEVKAERAYPEGIGMGAGAATGA